jgi:hypothetical protein
MTGFFTSADTYRPHNLDNGKIVETLPPGYYTVAFDSAKELFYLKTSESFTIPDKIYGNGTKFADKLIDTYLARGKNTGAMLVGDKGSGKTLVAKYACARLVNEYGMPVISVTTGYSGQEFLDFMQQITQPCVVLFDEFEKNYKGGNSVHKSEANNLAPQNSLLTLFDGVLEANKLFIVTANDLMGIDSHLINRPSRFYYFKEYNGVEPDAVVEYCTDRGMSSDHIKVMLVLADVYPQINFDTVCVICEESIRYGLSPSECVVDLNVLKTTYFGNSRDINYDITFSKLDGTPYEYTNITTLNPILSGVGLLLYLHNKQDTDAIWQSTGSSTDEDADKFVRIEVSSFLEHTNSSFVYKVGEVLITLTKKPVDTDAAISSIISKLVL